MSAHRRKERPVSAGSTAAPAGRWSPPSRAPALSSATDAGGQGPSRGPFLVAVAAAALAVAGLLLVLAPGWVGVSTKRVVSDVALVPLAGFVAVAGARAARRDTDERRRLAWWLLAAAGLCWMFGELNWYENRYIYDSAADPSWADVFYLAAVVPAAGALLAFSRGGPRGEQLRRVLGALVVAGSVLFVSKALALSVIVPAADGARPLARAVYLAYPLTDIVLATLALLVLMSAQPAWRLSLTLLAVGILAFALTDTWYSYRGALGEYEPGSVWDVGWAVGYLLVGLAALVPDTTRAHGAAREPEERQPVYPSSLAVYVPVLVAIVVAVVLPQPPADPVLVGSGVLVLVLFGLRQVLLARDNARLGQSLQGRVAELRLLAERTERVVASVAEGVLDVGDDGRIRYANPAAARLLGRAPTSLPGTHERELFPDADAAASSGSSVIARALRSGEEATAASATFRRADGAALPVELAVRPVLDHGELLGVVVVFRDVAERPESGTAPMELADCDARDLLRTTVQGLAPLAHQYDVALVVAPSQGRVLADADRIVQTLTNLVGNAVKFSPPGSTVTLSAAPLDGMVQFRVRDEGRGLPPDGTARIFDRFEQVDSSDADKGGSGLGLTISRSIVERHGGTIDVESTLGAGSTFSVLLPAAHEPRATTDSAAPGVSTLPGRDDASRPAPARRSKAPAAPAEAT